ncbi:hypothetical protein ACE1TF_01640 [Geomicrobium sp. JSM 1781026]|uniref:hypothetical protein n=1 Tax=Geomicrobium sp. JSM 1781026 TaxID=3344580 RepID=UPI0035C14289
MTFFQDLKDQITQDLDQLFEKREPKVTSNLPVEQELNKLDKQMRQLEKSLDEQQQLEAYFLQELDQSREMMAKRAKQKQMAVSAGEEELIALAHQEVVRYEELVTDYEVTVEEQKTRVKNIEKRVRELHFLKKNLKRQHLSEHARTEEEKAEKMIRHWFKETDEREDEKDATSTEYVDLTAENSELDERFRLLEEQNEHSKQ